MSVAQDILEIQMLPQRYADAVMRHNGDDWQACWARDGEWYLREEPVKGRENIRKIWEQAMAGFPFAVFLVQPAIVEVNGDTGTCRSYVTEIHGTPSAVAEMLGAGRIPRRRHPGHRARRENRQAVRGAGPRHAQLPRDDL